MNHTPSLKVNLQAECVDMSFLQLQMNEREQLQLKLQEQVCI